MKKLFLIAMKFIKLNFIWRLKREKFINNNRKKFHFVNAPTIITNNCVGGLMYHELGTKFTSPIINLFMDCEDFIKFCENIEYYLKLDLIKSEHSAEWHLQHKNIEADDNGYPVALLGDLTLFLVHYKTFEEGRNKWNERKQRVQFDNIRIIGSERDGCTEQLKNRFERLPYKKVMFTHLPDTKHASCFYIKGFENKPQVDVLQKDGYFSGKRYYDQFDWIAFLLNDK